MGKYLILLFLNGISYSRNYFFTQGIICESCIQSSSQLVQYSSYFVLMLYEFLFIMSLPKRSPLQMPSSFENQVP